MNFSQNKPTASEKMYQNPILEFLSLSNPKLMIVFHLALSFLILYLGYWYYAQIPVIQMVLCFLLGVMFWSLAEYLMHRYIFHFISSKKFVKAIHYAVHGYHHKVPHDYRRLFMPPVPAFLLLGLFFSIFYVFLGKYTFYFHPGFEIGYLAYSLIHYSIHRRVHKNKLLQKIWVHHAAHHYKFPEKAYGVSSPFWDIIFGTMPPIDEEQKSQE
jgi:4-hydroxysphinganine ceramide fatty acyl 2-hydroxylase